jgi:hypothetical protein
VRTAPAPKTSILQIRWLIQQRLQKGARKLTAEGCLFGFAGLPGRITLSQKRSKAQQSIGKKEKKKKVTLL